MWIHCKRCVELREDETALIADQRIDDTTVDDVRALGPLATSGAPTLAELKDAFATAADAARRSATDPAAEDELISLRPGNAQGPLVAGNLTLLCSLLGTPYMPCLDGAVLLIEDVSEAPYRIDRMLTQLRLAGILDRLSALVLGTFDDCFVPTEMKDSPTLEEIVDDAVGDRNLPVVAGVAYGHTRRRVVLPLGVSVCVDGDAGSVVITQAAVL